MSTKENSAETKTVPSTNNTCLLLLSKLRACLVSVFISKATFATWGLVVSHTFMKNFVSSQLMNELNNTLENQRIAAIITNLQEGLSSISLPILYLISQDYTGSFTMLTFCSSASTMGLMLFWIYYIGNSRLEGYMIYVAIFLVTLGSPGRSMSEEFLDYHLYEKVRAKRERKSHDEQVTDNASDKRPSLRQLCAVVVAYATSILLSSVTDEKLGVGIGALVIAGIYLLFYFANTNYTYSKENLPARSNLRKICKMFKVAYRELKLRYPWRLQKAAADHDPIPKGKETEDARKAQSVGLLIGWGFTFFAYSLACASGNTFFVAQATNMSIDLTGHDLSILFAIRSIMGIMLPFVYYLVYLAFKRMRSVKMTYENYVISYWFKGTNAIVLKTCIGMVCAMVSCILAWRVEVLMKDGARLTIMASFTPQFLLLGIAEWLAEDGLQELFQSYAPKSVRNFDESFSELVIGTWKLFTIVAILIFSDWIGESAHDSHLDRYYLLLAALNFLFIILFVVFYVKCAYKNEYPEEANEDGISTIEDGTVVFQNGEANVRGVSEVILDISEQGLVRRAKFGKTSRIPSKYTRSKTAI